LGELPTTNEVTTVAGQATEESQSSDSPVPASDIGSAPPTTVAPGETLTLHDLLTDDGVYPRCFVLLGPVGTDTEPTELAMLHPGIEVHQSLRGCRSVPVVGRPTVTTPPLDQEVYELCAYGDPSSCIRFE